MNDQLLLKVKIIISDEVEVEGNLTTDPMVS